MWGDFDDPGGGLGAGSVPGWGFVAELTARGGGWPIWACAERAGGNEPRLVDMASALSVPKSPS